MGEQTGLLRFLRERKIEDAHISVNWFDAQILALERGTHRIVAVILLDDRSVLKDNLVLGGIGRKVPILVEQRLFAQRHLLLVHLFQYHVGSLVHVSNHRHDELRILFEGRDPAIEVGRIVVQYALVKAH